MFCYFATLVANHEDAAAFTQSRYARSSVLQWNASTRSVELHAGVAPVPGVDINIALHQSPYFTELATAVRRNSECFKITALWHDCSQPPLAYNLLIDPGVFSAQMATYGAVVAERYVQKALMDAFRCSGLLVKMHSADEQPDWEHALKWVTTRDQAGATHISYPHHISVPGTEYVFCLQELTFVRQTSALFKNIDLRGGLLVGARSAGKTRLMKELVQRGGMHAAGEQCPSYMRAVTATLVVAPPHLIDQWRQELEPDVVTLVITDLNKWQLAASLHSFDTTDVIITTPRFLVQQANACTVHWKHRLRKLRTNGGGNTRPVFLTGVFWHRVVFDEIGACVDEVIQVMYKSLRCRMWWGLQGGVSMDSLAMNTLTDAMLSPVRDQVGSLVHQVQTLQKLAVCAVPRLPHLIPLWLDKVHTISLHPHERAVYDVFYSAQRSTLDLTYICGGSFKPLEVEYMCVVEDVLDAIPLGLHAIENTFITYDDEDDDEEDDDEEDEHDEEEAGEGDAQQDEEAAQQDEEAAQQDEEAEGARECDDDVVEAAPVVPGGASEPSGRTIVLQGTTSQGLTFELRSVGLTAFIESKMKMIEERKQFFRKTALSLASGEMQMSGCPVCLCDDATCLMVCGHTICQSCVIRLVEVAHKNSLEDEDASNAEVMCPTCRCELDRECIFWITGPRPRLYSKATALLSLLKQFTDEHQNAVVIAESQLLLQNTIMPQMQAAGVSCMLLKNGGRVQRGGPQKINEWMASGRTGRVVFTELLTLRGMKLDHVHHVVLFHPLASTSKTLFENDILQSFMHDDKSAVLTVHTLAASGTVEAACV